MRRSVVAFGALFTLVLSGGCSGPLSTLDPAGPAATSVAWLWWAMFAFATVVLLAVVALWIHAMRRDPGDPSDARAKRVHSRWLVGGGLVLPLASVTVLLGFGIPIGHNMLALPTGEDVVRIDVTGHQWWWEVTYPEAGVSLRDELHIPVDVPVDVHITGGDVIHSFWVPRLGGKLDAIPGHTGVLRLRAQAPGIYRGQCAEFCGTGHAHMSFTVEAHPRPDFDAWLEAARTDD